jgi:hypothetical protein
VLHKFIFRAYPLVEDTTQKRVARPADSAARVFSLAARLAVLLLYRRVKVAGLSPAEQIERCGLIIDRIRIPFDLRARI